MEPSLDVPAIVMGTTVRVPGPRQRDKQGAGMVTIRIGNETRNLEDADESWITQQVGGRQEAGASVCVEVRIEIGALRIRLATPGCGSGTAGTRPPRPDEAKIIQAWERLGLGSDAFSGGNVVAFTKQLRGLL
jgi:hypothetical protein